MKYRQSFAWAPSGPRLARQFVRTVLASLDLEVIQTIELLVSELATNCVEHARTGFELTIDVAPTRVDVEITDSGQGQPTLRHPVHDEPKGRGLLIVDALADEWSVELRSNGKLVRFCKQLRPRGSGALEPSDRPVARERRPLN